MFADVKYAMVTRASSKLEEVNAGSFDFWGISIGEILTVLKEKALEAGREHRAELEQAAKSAVDDVVALDIPFIPPGVETKLDEATRAAGYAAIVTMLDAIFGQAA